MSTTRARTLQMRRAIGTIEGSGGWRSGDERTSLIAEKSPFWLSESDSGEREEDLLPGRSFSRRARRLARVGGLSSLSGIPPESSIVTRHFRVSGGGGRSPREG